MSKKGTYLSASRIKTLESCSWYYWCNYHLKIPQQGNDGMWMGSVCHLVFEVLQLPKHRKHYDLIVDGKTITASPAVGKLVSKHLDKYGILDDEHFRLVDKMVLVGLNEDFFVEGSKLLDPELKFDIENKEPKYRIFGFIDKTAHFVKDKIVEIHDYKSSKQKFKGEGLESNIQAMMYSLVAKKKWPKLKPVVKFVFLRFPRATIQELQFSDDALKGLELYLEEMYKKVSNFSEKDAGTSYAADKPKPKDGSWGGCLNCGFSRHRGHLKKDGSTMWACPYKFSQVYYAVKDEWGKVLKTSFENDLTAKEGEQLVKMTYKGCPKFS